MTLPKEELEREMPAAGHDQPIPPESAARTEAASGAESGWRMPGGEDLLNFALSAGLPAGVWWLEMRTEAPAASSEDPCTAPVEPGGAQ